MARDVKGEASMARRRERRIYVVVLRHAELRTRIQCVSGQASVSSQVPAESRANTTLRGIWSTRITLARACWRSSMGLESSLNSINNGS